MKIGLHMIIVRSPLARDLFEKITIMIICRCSTLLVVIVSVSTVIVISRCSTWLRGKVVVIVGVVCIMLGAEYKIFLVIISNTKYE